MTYTPFNSIKTIEEGSKKSEFFYGGDEQRKKNQYKVNNVLQYTKFYLDDYELITYPDQTSKEIAYLEGGCIIVKQRDNQVKTYFAHTDNLGSLQSITDENGNQLSGAEFSFDPWGNLRHKDNWLLKYGNESQQSAFEIIGRGFTGHEHMTEFGLINMNGRVYDQQLGQFIQPDNFIQYPGFSQSYNRYSYCINNPLAFTDPSGELFGIDDAILIAGLVYAAGSIGYNTWLNWNNYGREAGLNTLTYSIAFTIGGYIVGAALGELIPYLINSAYSGQGLNFANPLRPDAGAGVGQSASNVTKLAFSSETRAAITQSSIGIGGAYGTFYSNRSSQDNLRSPTIDPNISPKTNVSTSNSNGFDWFSTAYEAQKMIPVWGPCVIAGECWNRGDYLGYFGWGGIALAEGLTAGIVTDISVGAKAGSRIATGMMVGNSLSRAAIQTSKNSSKISILTKGISDWLGEGAIMKYNKAGVPYFMSKKGDKMIRFDWNNPHGDKIHMHFRIKNSNGKWIDAVKEKHRIYFK